MKKTRCSITLALALCMAAISGAVRADLPTQTPDGEHLPPTRVDIHVRNVRLDLLLHAQATLEKRNQIISHFVAGRVDMDVDYYPLKRVEEHLLSERGFARVKVPGTSIEVVSKPCALSLWRGASVYGSRDSDALLSQRIGLYFEAAELKVVNGTLIAFLFGDFNEPTRSLQFSMLDNRVISIRTHSTIREVLEALAVATGFDIIVDSDAKTLIYKPLPPPSDECRPMPKIDTPHMELPHPGWKRSPLEYYSMSDIRFVGWLRYSTFPDNPLALAIVGLDDFYPVRIRTFLGKDFGVVLDIDHDGVLIKEYGELDPSHTGKWGMRRRLLPYVSQSEIEQ